MTDTEQTIKNLFDSENRKFEIPSYQRAYSWEKIQINQFIDDLKNTENQYYLGHFIFENKNDDVLYVIDGQQRLTTLIIFFSVFKNEFISRVDNAVNVDIKNITDRYLKDLKNDTQKFTTVSYDNNFFREEIIEYNPKHSQEIDTDSKGRIREAKEIFEKEFAKTSDEDLLKWARLIENATITKYICKNKIQATQIFGFQNDRGKKLSNLEILKAYFMLQIYLSGSSPENVSENIKYLEDEFSKIYRQIVRITINEDEVLNYYWRCVSGKGLNSVEVIRGVKDQIAKLKTKKELWIKEYVSGLSQAFQTVEKIERSDESFTKDLLHLNHMSIAYPFIIKAYKFKASEQTIHRLIKLFENITFRYLLRGGRAEIESRLSPYLESTGSEGSIDKDISSIVNKLKTDWWWDYWNDQTVHGLLNGYFYQNRVDNYLLWKYELFISDKNHPKPHKVSFQDLIRNESIEHIAPVTKTNGDPIANGYGCYEDKETPSKGIVSGEWLNAVGNLMLISQSHNSSIGNKPFTNKLDSYGIDNLLNQQKEISKFVSDTNNPVWDKAAIERRQTKIIDAAMKIWDLDKI